MKKSQRDTYLGEAAREAAGCLTASGFPKKRWVFKGGFTFQKRRERGLDVCFQRNLMSLQGSSVFGMCALCKEQDLNISKSYIEWLNDLMSWRGYSSFQSSFPGWSLRKIPWVPLVNSWWRHFTNKKNCSEAQENTDEDILGCLKMGYIPNEIAIFHRDNDQQNHWV